jgi:hypothetical protein
MVDESSNFHTSTSAETDQDRATSGGLNGLADAKLWVRYKLEHNEKGVLTKVPYSPHGPGKASHTKSTHWGTLAQAQASLERWGGDGLGIVSAAVDHDYVLGCLDIDGCYAPPPGKGDERSEDYSDERTAWVDPAATILDGHYVETSVSGTGLHFYFLVRRAVAEKRRWRVNAKRPSPTGRKDHGFELAARTAGGYYLTTTLKGDGELRVLEEPALQALYDYIVEFRPKKQRETHPGASAPDEDLHSRTLAAIAILKNDGRFVDRDDWLVIGMAVHDGTGGSTAGLRAWTAWTERLHKDAETACARAWPTFIRGKGVTVATLFKFAREDDYDERPRAKQHVNGHDETPAPDSEANPDEPDHLGPKAGAALPLQVLYEDIVAYAPQGNFIFMPTGQTWPATSVNARLQPVRVGTDKKGKGIYIPASKWIAEHRPVEQMTWAPGEPQIIRNRLVLEGGWVERSGASVFNHYKPPTIALGDPAKATPWIELAHTLWPEDAELLIAYFAHRRQRPHEKINHAKVLGGVPGIGKDTLLEGVIQAVGPWNVQDISPAAFLGRFNSFARSVILRINEARDGGYNRYQLYEHMKTYAAAPPEVLRVDEKNLREYYVLNRCAPIITINKITSLYLPPDDRRHHVAWSEITPEHFGATEVQRKAHWDYLWAWYYSGGLEHVAAYLAAYDLSKFNPKAPPPKTPAFWSVVDSNRVCEGAELADILDKLGNPMITTLEEISRHTSDTDFKDWLRDRRNRTQIPHRFEDAGYHRVRNGDADDGLWKIDGSRQAVYGRHGTAERGLLGEAGKLARQGLDAYARQRRPDQCSQ